MGSHFALSVPSVSLQATPVESPQLRSLMQGLWQHLLSVRVMRAVNVPRPHPTSSQGEPGAGASQRGHLHSLRGLQSSRQEAEPPRLH